MKAFLTYDFNKLTKKVLEDILASLDCTFSVNLYGEIQFSDDITDQKLTQAKQLLKVYGIQIINNQKHVLTQRIKDVIFEMVTIEKPLTVKSSFFLSGKLNRSYGYLSNIFSENTFTSIENFTIIQKIELAKTLLIRSKLTLTEIAFKLNYSSVAHLSTQFKTNTGLTPSAFQRIIKKRKALKFNK
jgi:AraC-like DNA-binding protein